MEKRPAPPHRWAPAENALPAVQVDHATKTYRLFDSHSDRVKEAFHPFKRKYHRQFHALHDVSFSVAKGEACGIVGRNGSGKSTLLGIVCGVLKPSGGQVTVNGRVSALLELGAGFNPEFTGRQNVYLNAQILGLPPEEIEARMADIVEFAEIGRFIDQPVKTYSSGMYLRLAFAVAVNVTPDILVVDEALAVGDALFQRKCISRIQEIRQAGGAILFVSHDAAAVIELCDRALLLDQGEKLTEGPPKSVVSKYHQLLFAPPEALERVRGEIRAASGGTCPDWCPEQGADTKPQNPAFDPGLVPSSTLIYPSRGPKIENPRILGPDGEPVNVLQQRQDYVYAYSVHFPETACNVRFGMMIKTITGVEVGGSVSAPQNTPIACIAGGRMVAVNFRFTCLLNAGVYFMNAGVLGCVDGAEVFLHRIIDAISFRVVPHPGAVMTGIVDLLAEPMILIDGAKDR